MSILAVENIFFPMIHTNLLIFSCNLSVGYTMNPGTSTHCLTPLSSRPSHGIQFVSRRYNEHFIERINDIERGIKVVLFREFFQAFAC
ncbi:MAG: hypothetical protein OJF50_000226 [Nitrospira sp.]|nr:hypothetical protein [Nitrospira sp.]